MGGPAERWQPVKIGQRELELVQEVAATIQTTDPAALESDLMFHLLRLKRQPPRRVRSWEAFLRTALHNKALNWIRDHPNVDDELTSLDAPLPGMSDQDNEPATLLDRLRRVESDLDSLTGVGIVLGKCDPWLCAVWKSLSQTDGNVKRAAIRLRVHPNTIRAARRRIAEILKRHEFGPRR